MPRAFKPKPHPTLSHIFPTASFRLNHNDVTPVALRVAKVFLQVQPRSLAWRRSIMQFISHLTDLEFWLSNPIFLLITAFQIWMLIDAIRRQEWIWVFFIFIGSGLGACFYYFFHYRGSGGSSGSGFELPGAGTRQRIKELEGQIYHLDKAHHHFQLGDVYFRRNKFDKAEQSYRAALEREPGDVDARAHLGQALLRQKRPQEAKPILQQVCVENPKHDYGHSMMAYAETLMALGENTDAIAVWQIVLQNNNYARARVQLAELYSANQQPDLARNELKEVLADDFHAPKFQRKRDRVWVGRAKSLLRKIGK